MYIYTFIYRSCILLHIGEGGEACAIIRYVRVSFFPFFFIYRITLRPPPTPSSTIYLRAIYISVSFFLSFYSFVMCRTQLDNGGGGVEWKSDAGRRPFSLMLYPPIIACAQPPIAMQLFFSPPTPPSPSDAFHQRLSIAAAARDEI